MISFDINGDELISYHEATIAYAIYGHLDVWVEKAKQINCVSCFENEQDFY